MRGGSTDNMVCIGLKSNNSGPTINIDQIIRQEKQKQLVVFSERLEKQLKDLTAIKNQQIQQLNSQNQSMKMQVLKLQHRNKLDQQNQNRLRQKVKQLQEIIEQYKRKFNQIKITNTKQVIKQVFRQKQIVNPVIQQELQNVRKQIRILRQKLAAKQQGFIALSEEYEKQKIRNKNDKDCLLQQIKSLNQLLVNKNKQIQILKTQISYQEQRIQILNKPSDRSYSPVIITKKQIQTPQIKTLYIEKPIQKTVFFQVQKKITQFIQPQRPVVNRIINCPQKQKCQCQDTHYRPQRQIQHTQDYQSVYNKYQNVISSYKNQRQKLVQNIRNRDSDINLLQKQVNILSSKAGKSKLGNNPDVHVTVLRDDDKVNIESGQQKINNKQTKLVNKKELNNRKKK